MSDSSISTSTSSLNVSIPQLNKDTVSNHNNNHHNSSLSSSLLNKDTRLSVQIIQILLDILNHSNTTSNETNSSESSNLMKNDVINDSTEEITNGLSPKFMRVSLYIICVAGIILNVFVFYKKRFKTKRQSYTTRISLQLLCFMAIADTISLASLLLVLCTQYLGIQNEFVMNMICKIDLYLIHSASAFSIWCWLVLSAVRYVALYRPYAHLKINNEPLIAVILIVIMCGIFESWILYDATYFHEFRGCGEVLSEKWEKRFQIVEICWSYFLPVIVITILDFKVICCHHIWSTDINVVKLFNNENNFDSKIDTTKNLKRQYTVDEYTDTQMPINSSITVVSSVLNSNQKLNKTSSPTTTTTTTTTEYSPTTIPLIDDISNKQISSELSPKSQTFFSFTSVIQNNLLSRSSGSKKTKRRLRQMKILRRCLLITLLDLGMNLPNYLFRLYVNIIPIQDIPDQKNLWFVVFQDITQLLYFAQFALNAFYLVCIIYDTPQKKQNTIRVLKPLRAS